MSNLKPLTNILVIIPALNEAATIGQVIQELQTHQLFNICVVDNGSSDRTAQIATEAGAKVVYEPQRGYGQACWRGMQTADSQIDWILFCDGDGSDDLSQLPHLLTLRNDHDLILGNRRGTPQGKQQLTPVQNFGNWLATTLIKWGWGYEYHDLGPLRLIRKDALESIKMKDRGYGWTVEMQARAVELGLSIRELPVNYHPRQGGKSKIGGSFTGSCQAGFVILATLAQLYGQKLKQPWSFPLPQRILCLLSAWLLVLGSVWIRPYGDFLNQTDAVPHFWRGIGVMGLGFMASWGLRRVTAIWFWGVALATRILVLGMYPGDDIWRYIWEGLIQTLGFSPYELAPSASILTSLRPEWWIHINHPDVTAIYPPITQLGFRLLASVSASVLAFKIAFMVADLGICWLLKSRFGYRATILYAWNPLIIYSFTGGGHYDSWFLLPLVAAWLWFEIFEKEGRSEEWAPSLPKFVSRNIPQSSLKTLQYWGSALLLGISIALKWMSLPVLFFLAWRSKQEGKLQLSLGVILLGCLPMLLSALPFCSPQSCPLVPWESNFVTQGRSAELIPYLISSVWDFSRQANWLYALPLGLIVLWLTLKASSLQQFIEGYLIALMLFSPIIHAWYFTWLVPSAVASRNLGTRLISLSAFVYFALPHNLATGNSYWVLSHIQQWLLWSPFLIGLLLTTIQITVLAPQQDSKHCLNN